MKKMMKSKGMKRGGKTKAKGMAKGGMRGGRRMMMKNGGKAMKAKGMAKGGATGGKKKKAAAKPAMTLAQLRAAAKKKGFKLVKA
jgi:hypothetical protein